MQRILRLAMTMSVVAWLCTSPSPGMADGWMQKCDFLHKYYANGWDTGCKEECTHIQVGPLLADGTIMASRAYHVTLTLTNPYTSISYEEYYTDGELLWQTTDPELRYKRCYDWGCTFACDAIDDVDEDGSTVLEGDCNDKDAAIHPGAPELCNAKDDNCNGATDEGPDLAAGGACLIGLMSLILDPPTTVGEGKLSHIGAEGIVTLTRPAPSGGAAVTLSADTVWPVKVSAPKPNVVSVQSSVTIAEGKTSTVPIVTDAVLFPHLVTIKAHFGGITKTAELTVLPPAIPSLGPEADARVQAIIAYFLQHATGSTPRELYSNAWGSAGGIRGYTIYHGSPETGQDIHLAAAEHYLFWLTEVLEAGLLEIPLKAGIASVYDLGKWFLDIRGSEAPTSPSTPLSTQWSLQGVIDGLLIRFGLRSISQLENIEVIIHSPVDILVSDAAGHKIGVNPSTGNIVNDFGPLASYTGPGTEPQTIFIGLALPGPYTVTGIGTGSGPYTLTVTRRHADGSILETQTVTGVASLGTAITPLTTVVPGPARGDLDGDGDVDQHDLNILLRDRNKSVDQSVCGARCDLDDDSEITALDVRKLQLLCSRPRCATQ